MQIVHIGTVSIPARENRAARKAVDGRIKYFDEAQTYVFMHMLYLPCLKHPHLIMSQILL
jgi:hypothetical protein